MKRKVVQLMGWCVIALLFFTTIMPIVYVLGHSLKGEVLINTIYISNESTAFQRMFIKPFYINLDQYYRVFFRSPEFLMLFWNSFKMVVPIVVGQLFISIFAAYGFSKLRFWGSDMLFMIYIIIMLMPFQVTVVPNYIIMDKLQLLDHYGAIMLPGVFGTFGVFFLKQFMEKIDNSFLEQARVEGASEVSILVGIVIPMCKPVILSTSLLLFIDYWNMVEQPLIFLSSKDKQPLSLYLANINTKDIGIAFACSVVYMILPLLVTAYVQNDLKEGMNITSLK